MAQLVKLVQNDTGPPLTLSMTDKLTGATLDLTGMVSASIKIVAKGTTTPIIATLTLTTVGSPTNGQLTFTPTALMTANPGYFDGEVEITFSGAILVSAFDLVHFYIRADI